MTLPRFYAIVDRDLSRAHGWEVPALARACLDAGARLLQVRAKTLGAGALLDLCEEVARDAAAAGATLIVNDRADVARLVPGAGVHLGQDDLSPAAARRIVGPERLIGFSTHTPGQVIAGLGEPIGYLAVGPVFGTRTKETGYGQVGLDLVRYAARAAGATATSTDRDLIPVVAIGGITLENASSVLQAGASSVALVSDLFTGGDPAERVRALVSKLE